MELQELISPDEILSSFPSQNWWAGELLYQYKGFWFYPPYLLGSLNVITQFKPLSSDVILASFPKTGTTWLKSLIFSIVFRSSRECLKLKNAHDLIPTLETTLYLPNAVNPDYTSLSASATAATGSSRIFSTHLPYQIFTSNLDSSACKIVYVTREPKDTLISYWHFVNRSAQCEGQPWPLDVAVDQFCNGTVPFGPYYNHVLGYRKESQERPHKVFFITYEELKKDPKTHLKKLAEFLGFPFESGIVGEEEVEDIVNMCSFETLSNLEVNRSNDLITNFMLPYNSLFRRGQVGDHVNFLNPEMIQQIDEVTKEKFLPLGFYYGI